MKIRRIVAGFQASATGRGTIEALARRAAQMEAELLGLFIEDIELLRLATLPFASEIGYPSAARRGLAVEDMERALRAQAEHMRRAFAAAFENLATPWSFRVARGTLAEQLLAAVAEAPVPTLVLPPGADPDDEPQTVPLAGLTAARLAELLRGARPVLILPPNHAPV